MSRINNLKPNFFKVMFIFIIVLAAMEVIVIITAYGESGRNDASSDLDKAGNISCEECHDGRIFLPSYHFSGWRIRHGKMKKNQYQEEHGKQCDDCHQKNACIDCHKKRKPRSHTSFFRIRGHGLKADMDRQSCATCHKESFCIRCHQHTKPMNHKGNWLQRHGYMIPAGQLKNIGKCNVCHSAGWCLSCHK